jgi:hypothetical protein
VKFLPFLKRERDPVLDHPVTRLDLRKEAASLVKARRFAEAADAYRMLAVAEPSVTSHLLRVGECARRCGRVEEAAAAFRRAAREFAESGVSAQAMAACRLALEVDPTDEEARELLGDLELERLYPAAPPIIAEAPPRPPPEPIELPDDPECEILETSAALVTPPPITELETEPVPEPQVLPAPAEDAPIPSSWFEPPVAAESAPMLPWGRAAPEPVPFEEGRVLPWEERTEPQPVVVEPAWEGRRDEITLKFWVGARS